ncbi:class III signal peptide-containing protein [Thermococcus sp. ES12]|uniref:class III signal peptide-containing protein n=1 Tax=Thermococcus sp. ES12 TaxID=1638246 RepID=UPI00142F8C65|nr:class III signal peptide-containing protein [Thermococcus sp. ES12]NJE75778.1 class III signal peptide-containing protein [Thermococcus sp. ES12]
MKRKAQGAIEYLFMIAAALIIILIVVRQLQGRTSTATETIKNTSSALESNLTNLSSTS